MSNDVLVFVEQQDGQIKKASFEALAAGRETAGNLSGAVSAAIVGAGIRNLATQAAQHGATKVFVAESDVLAAHSGDGCARAIAACAEQSGAGTVLFAHTAMGKDLAPRVAQLLDGACTTDATQGGLKRWGAKCVCFLALIQYIPREWKIDSGHHIGMTNTFIDDLGGKKRTRNP